MSTTTTPYAAAFERHLKKELLELAASWQNAGVEARKEFADKITKSPSTQYPFNGLFAQTLQWEQGDVIKAEIKEGIAFAIDKMLGENADSDGPAVSAQDALKNIQSQMKRYIADELRFSGSTSITSNVVTHMQAAAALEQTDDKYTWDSLPMCEMKAHMATRDELVGDYQSLISGHKSVLSELTRKHDRAKNPERIAELEKHCQHEEEQIENLKQTMAQVLADAGAPAEKLW